VGPRTVLDDVEKRKFLPLPGLEFRPLGRPARSQSLIQTELLLLFALLCHFLCYLGAFSEHRSGRLTQHEVIAIV
jgi:hypothetical protein